MTEKKYDLEERTESFGKEVIKFAKRIPKTVINTPLITQLIKSGTSVGANYCEADDAESKKDFRHKIGVCKKKARETKYWLKMITMAAPKLEKEAKKLWQEAKELNLIFNSITNKLKKKSQN